jgi:hypothetical protein
MVLLLRGGGGGGGRVLVMDGGQTSRKVMSPLTVRAWSSTCS